MAEDSTRRLLKVFGVAVTECEDALTALEAALGDPAAPRGRAARELGARWVEVSRLILDYHARAQEAVAAHLAARRDG